MTQSITRRMFLFLCVFTALFAFAGVNFAAAQEEGTITLVYDSNPDEVLGTFDVVPFSEAMLLSRIASLNANLETMRVALGSGAVDCNSFIMGYEAVLADSVFFADVPAQYAEADTLYQLTFVLALDRTRPAYFGCQNDGRVNNFDYGLAYTTLESTIDLGKRAQAVAEAVSGQEAPPPVDEPEVEEPDMTGNAITVRWTDIFSAPDSTTSTGNSLPPNTRVNVLMTEGAWSQIESDLGNGYVPSNALDFDAPPPVEEDEGDMDEMPPAPDVPDDEFPDGPDDISDDEFQERIDEIYVNWTGETADPRVSQAVIDAVMDDQFLRPALLSFDDQDLSIVALFSFVNSALTLELLDEAISGGTDDCFLLTGFYILMGKSPVFKDVPADYQFLVGQYESAVAEYLRLLEPIATTCLSAGVLPDTGTLTAIRTGVEDVFANFFALTIAVDAERAGFVME